MITKFTKMFFVAMCATTLIACNEDDAVTPVTNEPQVITDGTLINLLAGVVSNDTSIPTIIDNYSCFDIQLPVEVIANGQQITINTEADYTQIETIFNQDNFDEDTVDFVYPITVEFSNYQVIEVTSESHLYAVSLDCSDVNMPTTSGCVSVNYPITIMGYNTAMELEQTYVVTDDAALNAIFIGTGDQENYAVQYPVSITGYDGEVITVDTNEALLTVLQAEVAECQANSCDSNFTPFQQAYGAVSLMSDVVEEFTMDALVHEYTFSMAQSGTICSIGYKAEYQPNPIPYLIEIVDASDNVIYSGSHSFSTTMMEYIAIPPVSINADEAYTIRRSVASYNIGMGIGTVLIRSQNLGALPGILPYTQGDITITQSRFYGGGGTLAPDYHMLPMIDFVFKPM